jgi:hypothetical protein
MKIFIDSVDLTEINDAAARYLRVPYSMPFNAAGTICTNVTRGLSAPRALWAARADAQKISK